MPSVFCRKYKQDLEGLTIAPLPGAKGQDILANVSKKAWEEWMQLQTRLINEKQLNLMDLGARTYLSEQLEKFLSGSEFDQAEGYIPPSE